MVQKDMPNWDPREKYEAGAQIIPPPWHDKESLGSPKTSYSLREMIECQHDLVTALETEIQSLAASLEPLIGESHGLVGANPVKSPEGMPNLSFRMFYNQERLIDLCKRISHIRDRVRKELGE